jgi:hypothetical protein
MTQPKRAQPAADTAGELAAVVAMRRLADDRESKAVRAALREGWSWSRIA